MTEPTQLKPCPFCGSEADMDQFESASWGGLLTVIGCSSSECHMSPATDEVPVEMAIAAWNSRPTEDAAIKERDAQIVAWLLNVYDTGSVDGLICRSDGAEDLLRMLGEV